MNSKSPAQGLKESSMQKLQFPCNADGGCSARRQHSRRPVAWGNSAVGASPAYTFVPSFSPRAGGGHERG